MEKEIEKCVICGEPYWIIIGMELREGTGNVCSDCVEKADKREQREMNKPPVF